MSVLEQVTYYRLPRDEDGRRSREHDVVFEMALRWQPFDTAELNKGAGLLRRLRDGDKVSVDEVVLIGVYLCAAVEHYRTADEPYPGRNEEAIRDLRNVAALFSMVTS